MAQLGTPRGSRVTRSILVASVLFVSILGAVLSSALPVLAEVGPLLAARPWGEEPQWAETYDDLVFFDRGHTKGVNESIKIFYWDSVGRIKFYKDDPEPPFSLGYRILTMDIDSENGFLDGQLNDVSLVGAGEIGEVFDGWRLSLVGGLGTANDGHWSNDDALYGLGTVDLWTELTEDSSIHTGLYYDGNRALLPDVPLPFVTYQQRLSDQLDLAVGIPDTSIKYLALKQMMLTFTYSFPVDLRVRADYEIIPEWGVYLFAQYSRAARQFYLEEEDNRRIFFEVDRFTTGVRWFTRWFDASLGIGYALDNRFRSGWDMRDLETVRDLSEEIYLSFTLQGTFP